MRNIDLKVDEKTKKMTIVIDLAEPGEPSASGKTIVIATTKGNVEVATDVLPGLKIGINAYVPK